jgi:hypoxanthine phosphoribosyltransferase
MVPACIISERLNLRNILVAAVMFYTGHEHTLDKPIFLQFPADPLLTDRRVLIVDDVWDSGRTIMAVRERVLDAGGNPETAVLHYKPGRNAFSNERPDYHVDETDAWIVYPWDVGEANLPSRVLESLSEA